MVKRTILFVVILAMSSNSYCQTMSLIQLVAKYQKARVELDRINPYETPDLCIEKSKQIIDLYKKIAEIDSLQIQPQSLFVPFSMAAYSYYGKKDIKNATPYLKEAWHIAQRYSSYLQQVGYTNDALIGIGTILRDAYTDMGEYENAIVLSKEIVSSYEKYNPKHLAFQQMAESQIYKAKDDVLKVIESDLIALDYFEQYGNDVPNFYFESLVNEILEGYMYINDYNGAFAFINNNRERLNNMIIGKDSLEFELLNQTNKYLYRIYEHQGLYQRAVNAAFHVSNYIQLSEGEDTPDYAIWMNNAACSYLDLYDSEDNPIYLNKADTLFNIAQEKWSKIPNREEFSDYATYLGNYGNLLCDRHEYEKAEVLLLKSLSLYLQQDCSENYILSAKSRLATLYGNNGNTEKSILLHKELLSKYEQREDTLQIARICNLLSQLYWMDMNNEEMGEYYANKAYETLYQAKVRNELAATITENLARIYYRLGLEERALQYSLESLKIKEDIGIKISPYELLNTRELFIDNFSSVFYFNPEGKESVINNIESLCNFILNNNSGNTRNEKVLCWKAKTVLGKTYMFFHRFVEAEEQFLDLLKIEEDIWGRNCSNYMVTLNNLAYCYSLKGDYEKCRNYSLECIKQDPTHTNYENVLSSSIALGDSSCVEKYLPLAFDASLEYLKKQFLYLGTNQREELIESGKSFGFSNLSFPASIYPSNDVCTQYAYNSALVYKGLLLSTEKDIETIITSISNEALKNEYEELRQMRQKLQTTSDSIDVATLMRNIELKEKKLIQSLRKYSDFTKNLDIDWRDVQKHLQRDDVAIEFVEIDKSIMSPNDTLVYYGAVILKKEWPAPKFVLLKEKQRIDSLIQNVITDFKEAEGKAYNKEEWEKINQQLFEMIWEPLTSYFVSNSSVYFSPVGMLALVPMENLQNYEGQLLNEQYMIYRLSSTKNLCLTHRSLEEKNAILFGGLIYDESGNVASSNTEPSSKREGWQYLPSTAIEIAVLDTMLRAGNITTRVYDSLFGTEDAFKKLSGSTISILHLATHGFYFDEDESDSYGFFHDMGIKVKRGTGINTLLRSGLMLSGGQNAWLHGKKNIPQDKEDGILLASEISILNFQNVDHVTLSACQTGLGDISDDGVMGLQRGFKRAGVNSMLMTLWPVDDDATQIFMREFYRNLISGQTKLQSIQLAQKFLREYKKEYNNPYYWAAFIMLDGIE